MSGGLNEAFADMTGKAAEYYLTGTNSWSLGGDAINGAERALRFMDNPPCDGCSIDHQSNYQSTMNVQYTSGVFNKAFYLLSTRAGWNTKKAWITMATANVKYWSSTTTWNAAGNGVIDAACNLGYSTNDVKSILSSVGVISKLTDGKICSKQGMNNVLFAYCILIRTNVILYSYFE